MGNNNNYSVPVFITKKNVREKVVFIGSVSTAVRANGSGAQCDRSRRRVNFPPPPTTFFISCRSAARKKRRLRKTQ